MDDEKIVDLTEVVKRIAALSDLKRVHVGIQPSTR